MTLRHILVTGGAGYVGSHACKALAAAGFVPVTYDDLSTGHRDFVRWGPFVQASVHDASALRSVLRDHACIAILHFAGSAYVGESRSDPRKYFHNNVVGSLSVLDAALDQNVKHVVFSSTCATYGLPSSLPITEESPQLPINPYGDTKLAIERALSAYERAYGLRYAALRYFNAAGADPDGEIGERHDPETHLLPLAITSALGRRGPLTILGNDYPTPDGTAVRDYVHVTDLATAHVLALRRLLEGEASLVLNLGTGRGSSVIDVLDAVARACGTTVPTSVALRRPGDPPALVASASHARDVLGWEPRHSSLDTIVATAVRWHRGDRS